MLSDDEEERKAIICKDTMTTACRHDDDVSPAEASSSSSQRPFYFAILFLSLTILIDTAAGKGGPLQTWAEIIIPQLVRRYATTRPLFTDEEVGIDGKICPPDGFLDRALLPQTNSASQAKAKQTNEVTYSSDNDPRNKKSKPSSFPHCELKKWAQLHQHTQSQHTTTIGSRKCPVGQEYITHIYPKQFKSQQRTKTSTSKHSQSNNNVKILHIATPTNCIPTSTISSLQSFTEHYYSNNSNPNNPQIIIAIYIHSQETMDAFLYQRVWNVFPEVKEGLLCGMAKIRFVVGKVLDDLVKSVVVVGGGAKEDASSTNEKEQQEQQQQQLRKDNIANDIATLTKCDIWRYLILWEFGGTVIDLEVLQSLMDTPDNNAAETETPATSPLINVARQWFASEWFGKTNDTADGNSSSSITFSDGDAIITIVENDGGKRVPLTGIITASPNHPLLYFCVKWALRSMIDDNYLVWGESPDFRAFNAMGRNTDHATLQEGLKYMLGKEWDAKSKFIGNTNSCNVDKTKSIRFLNGNGIFPKSLASPMQDMISIVKRHIDNKSESPEDDSAIIKSFQGIEANIEKKHKEDKKFVSKPDPIIFSCMEYRLQVYTQPKSSFLLG